LEDAPGNATKESLGKPRACTTKHRDEGRLHLAAVSNDLVCRVVRQQDLRPDFNAGVAQPAGQALEVALGFVYLPFANLVVWPGPGRRQMDR
jgi:hypothetical protein